ncbi:putative NreB protein [Patulibacter medicamentivorans]|uniref:Putative NreB protein n=1 Tax=Patulibacter medicamentivorans TaxID=1097667 RepID=H0DZS0_9ACTN|nr:MFS transporter [Patulibacter medicamentivorans]EHN13024.1 putative NreB protein [Patulibacter medicamentivorans]
MLAPLRHPVYRRLFTAQVIALLGTGLTSVALALLAYDLAGADAGTVLGIALGLKMVAYVVIAPLTTGLLAGVDRRRLLVGLDLSRALAALAMPFVTAVWQVYVLIFLLNACSAGFTPTFQATIPDVLEDDRSYTSALSLSRLAYELESLASPALAAAALLLVGYHELFAANGVAFLCSALLVRSIRLPAATATARAGVGSWWARVSLGTRRYLAVPRLRGLLALNVGVAAASAMVIVNTVLLVHDELGRGGDATVAIALGAAGLGAMLAAVALPRLLRAFGDRSLMLAGGALLVAGLVATAAVSSYAMLLVVWALLGVGLALAQTPAGRLVQQSAQADDGPALFAAQFSLSHACWLVTYPVAGALGALIGLSQVAIVLAAIAGISVVAAAWLWRPTPTVAGDASLHPA